MKELASNYLTTGLSQSSAGLPKVTESMQSPPRKTKVKTVLTNLRMLWESKMFCLMRARVSGFFSYRSQRSILPHLVMEIE